jgi:hypothetical protein
LSAHERGQLSALLQKGHAAARTVRRAHTLLLAEEQRPTQLLAALRQTAAVTVPQTCKKLLSAGLEAALSEQPRPGARRTLDGREEAPLVALACRTPPAGRARWRWRLGAEPMGE